MNEEEPDQHVNFGDTADSVAQSLRTLAYYLEIGAVETPHTCAVVLAGAGQPVAVYSLGDERDSEHLLATLVKGQHCALNAVMPNGAQNL